MSTASSSWAGGDDVGADGKRRRDVAAAQLVVGTLVAIRRYQPPCWK
jgi:hypothetical protein